MYQGVDIRLSVVTIPQGYPIFRVLGGWFSVSAPFDNFAGLSEALCLMQDIINSP
jgi:hypothetical protein